MSISDLGTLWRDGEQGGTPLSAANLNARDHLYREVYEQAAEFRDEAEEAAEQAAAPTDAAVAELAAMPASQSRMALDRLYGGWVNVRAFGAVGDGSANDTAACQAALNAAGAGGAVFFPAGTYAVDPLYAPNRCRVTGAGESTVLRRRPATVTNTDSIGVLNFHGTTSARFTGVVVEHLRIDGNKANITLGAGADPYDVEGLSFKYVDRPRAQNVSVYNATAEGFDLDECADPVIANSWAEGCGGSGVHFSTGTVRGLAIAVTVRDCGHTLQRAGLDAYSSSSDCRFEACMTSGSYYGIHLNGPRSAAVNCADTASANNSFRLSGTRSSLVGCTSTGVTAGNGVTVAATATYSKVTGVDVSGASQAGVRVLAGATGVAVTGCVTVGNGAGVAGIWHQGDYGTAVGNVGLVTSTGTGTVAASNVTPV